MKDKAVDGNRNRSWSKMQEKAVSRSRIGINVRTSTESTGAAGPVEGEGRYYQIFISPWYFQFWWSIQRYASLEIGYWIKVPPVKLQTRIFVFPPPPPPIGSILQKIGKIRMDSEWLKRQEIEKKKLPLDAPPPPPPIKNFKNFLDVF